MPIQPAVTFAGYGFLHVGALHLRVNMIRLAVLGWLVIESLPKLLRFVPG